VSLSALLSLGVVSTVATVVVFFTERHYRGLLWRALRRSYRNPVSGLPNRYKLLEDIRHADSPVLALVKAERFTEINSCFGYSFGEEYIRSITEVILGTLNKTLSMVMLYHVDRDTFAILQENSRAQSTEASFEDRFSAIISLLRDQTFSIDGLRFPVPVTAGIAVGRSKKGVLLYNQAEQALTAALYAGRSEMLYTDSQIVKEDIVSNTSTLAMVSHAIKSDLVEVHFQPIMRNRGSKIAMYEALVRLKTEEGKLIPPGSFLLTTKLSSYHKELTRIVFEKTFKRMSNSDMLFTVNISMENILDEQFLPLLKDLMQKHRTCRDRCVIEITESEGVQNYRDVADFMEAVRELGYKVAIDDFGSGYSNFANVIHLPVDYVKFDGSLIQGMLNDARAEQVISKMNEMAKGLNIRTVAEFVDSRELLTAVRRIRIDYSQGFFIGKPAARLAKSVDLTE
jgi:EAL domain-containing protein (putative c-di-GMP-specific phosphodiesterase class I)/GGDEF domain-containing protein